MCTPYKQGYEAGSKWIIGSNLPSPPPVNVEDADAFIDGPERLSQWFQGMHDAIQDNIMSQESKQEYPAEELCHIDILYKLARLCRNTDRIYPTNKGELTGKLLTRLRMLDGQRYDMEVLSPKS